MLSLNPCLLRRGDIPTAGGAAGPELVLGGPEAPGGRAPRGGGAHEEGVGCPHLPSSQGASLQRRPRRRCHLPPELRPCGGARVRLRPSPGAGSAMLGPAHWTARPGGPFATQGGRMGARSTGPSPSPLGTVARASVSPLQPPHCLLTGPRPHFKPHGRSEEHTSELQSLTISRMPSSA